MKIRRLVILIVYILFLSLQTKAQDSVSYEGKKYPLYKDATKSFIVTSSDTVRFIVEAYPQYPGGIKEMYKYISKNITYPKTARRDKVQGRILISFIVNTQGRTDSILVMEGVREDLDREAMRVIQHMPTWQPGTQDKKPVNVRVSVPIEFKL